ncbi:DegT/DnrJ/EryC1/StrS family aminotransferase [Aeromonas jandaei]
MFKSGKQDIHKVSYQWPYYDEQVIESVTDVLRSGKVNSWTGDKVREFEHAFANYTQCKYAIAVANGTLALELALYSLGIGIEDEVIVTSRSFIASASAIIMRQATPVLADVDYHTQNITSQTIEKVLSSRTRAIIVVHLAGLPCDMDPIMDLANKNGIKVIEDCAQAHGACYKGRPVGSIGHIGAFSFCQDKIISTGGEGGMLVTNDHYYWEKAWSYKDHGKNYDTVFNVHHSPGYRWLHESFGTNWRLTEMQAAIGIVLLDRLPNWLKTRRKYADILTNALKNTPGIYIYQPKVEEFCSYYKFYILVKPQHLKPNWSRDRIMNEISNLGVPCFNTYAGPMNWEKAFANNGLEQQSALTESIRVGENCLQFLVHPTISEDDIHYTAEVIYYVMHQATDQGIDGMVAHTQN